MGTNLTKTEGSCQIMILWQLVSKRKQSGERTMRSKIIMSAEGNDLEDGMIVSVKKCG